jgi:PhnB protein
MSDQPLIDWLDDALRLAEDLRQLPRPEFRARLKAALERSASMTTVQTAHASVAPTGYRTVTPYLVVDDAPALLEFVARVFDAHEGHRAIGSAGGVHADVRIGDSMLMIGGGAPELSWKGPSRPAALHVYVPDADAVYERAVREGATVIQPPADHDYGERSASVKDPFGNNWYIATATSRYRLDAGLHDVNVCLHPLRADPVIAFLQRAFGAEEIDKYTSPEGVVRHATLTIGTSRVEMGEAGGPYQPMRSMFYIYVPDVDETYRRALDAGATSIAPPSDQSYGARSAGVEDAFGNSWYMATPLQK